MMNLMKLWRLEAVRGVAASYVAVGHIFPTVPIFFSFGQEAVMVFFLLSGFVIEYSSSPKLSRGFPYYFLKRFLRIYPVLVCMFGLVCLLTKAPVSSREFLSQLSGNLLMLQDFPEGKPHVIVAALFSGALWSLHYEWWFYMLYFPVAIWLSRRCQTHFVGLMGVMAATTYAIWPYDLNRLFLYFPIWWTGVVMARDYVGCGRVTLKSLLVPVIYLSVISLILCVCCIQWLRVGGHFNPGLHPFLEFRHVVGALTAIGIAIAWQRANWRGFRPLLKWGCFVAPISYALYIAHQPLLADASYLNGWIPRYLELPCYLAVLVGFCIFTELWLSRRLNRWFENLSGR